MHRKKQAGLGRLALTALAALGLFAFQAWAKPVSQQDAANVVSGWLSHPGSGLNTPLGNAVKETHLYNDVAGQPSFYVVYLKPSGFVIVPADDLVEPVIAFSPGGQFVNSDANPLGALVRRDLANRVAAARAVPKAPVQAAPPTAAQSKWAQLKSAAAQPPVKAGLPVLVDVRVAPLTQSQWSQTVVLDQYAIALYNYYTPPYGSSWLYNYPCGCVATAMSQLMYFWQWPFLGVGTESFDVTVDGYTWPVNLIGGDGAGGPYDWADMIPIAMPSMTTAQLQAIGALCADAGTSVYMQYTAASSGAYLTDAADALASTFMYGNAIQATNDYISDADIGAGLIGMLNPDLDAGFPALLAIAGPNGGHAIVADGYGYEFGTLYHHLNIGWSGLDNAWYNLPVINVWPDTFHVICNCVYNVWPYYLGGEIISGRVTDSSGNPIAGATITATGTNAYGNTVYTGGIATTSATGVYAFAPVPSSCSYALTASAAGYTFTPLTETTAVSTAASFATPYIPTSGNVWGADFTAQPPPAPGNLTVTLAPAGAVAAGARWNVDGGVWQTSGTTVSNLTPGDHDVYFNAINGWDSPVIATVTIVSNTTTTLTGTYVQPTGSLTVTILPAGAVTAGAAWNVNGGAWQTSGATLNLVGGSYTVNYNAISGWNSPSSAPATVTDNITTTVTGTYVQQFGSLTVTISPAAAITAGAKWNVDGGAWQASGATVGGLGVGSHTVAFKPLPSWAQPASQSVAVNLNQTAIASGTYTVDVTPPAVTGLLPALGAWNAPIETLITLHITDAGSGVDPATVAVSAGFGSGGAAPSTYEPIYTGATAVANSGGWSTYDASANTLIPGTGYSVGTGADYQIVFQPSMPFKYEDHVYVQVSASDLAGNAMTPYVYDFTVETRSFGCNARVDDGIAGNAFPATATDANGNVWVAWERTDATTQKGTIWLAERAYCGWKFGTEIPVTTVAVNGDCHKPAIAIGTTGPASGMIFVAYEVHGATPAIGVVSATTAVTAATAATAWTQVGPVTGTVNALTNSPAMAVDSAGNLTVAGVFYDSQLVQQIGVGALANGGTTWTVTKVTNSTYDQIGPAMAESATGVAYVVWTNTTDDNLYGADSSSAWAVLHQVTNNDNAGSPAIATEATGNVLHFVWATDDLNPDIQYADTYPAGGWPASPLATGTSVLDDTVGIYNAANPRIAVLGTTSASVNARDFIVWQDQRSNVSGDTNIMFVERKRDGTFGTNIRVSSVVLSAGIIANAAETNPAIGLTEDGAPCVAWTDLRENNTSHIYFASGMCLVGYGGAAQNVTLTASSPTFTDGTNTHFTEVIIAVPANAFTTPRGIALSELRDPPLSSPSGTGLFTDGSGLYLDLTGGTDQTLGGWVTVTVYLTAGVTLPSPLTVYRLVPPATPLDSWTWTTDLIRNVTYNATTHILTFQTMHLSTFGAGAPAAAAGVSSSGGGGGGGGCSMSPAGDADIFVLILPLAALGLCFVTRLLGRKRSANA